MADAKIRVKLGAIELEFEGEDAFLNEGLKEVVETIVSLSDRIPAGIMSENFGHRESDASPKSSSSMDYSTSTIAAHFGSKTGPDLAMCALANIQITGGENSASQKEIFKEMKSATGYFQENYGKNLSASLKNLVSKKKLNKVGDANYALSADEKVKFEGIMSKIG